jgi:uncharacterized repeat protein (TIGR01451 family)
MNAKRLTVQRVMTTLVLLVSALLGMAPLPAPRAAHAAHGSWTQTAWTTPSSTLYAVGSGSNVFFSGGTAGVCAGSGPWCADGGGTLRLLGNWTSDSGNPYSSDLNADGISEVLLASWHNGSTHAFDGGRIQWGQGGPSWSTINATLLPTLGAGGVAVADLNGDGRPEVIFANYYNGSSFVTDSYIYWGSVSGYSTSERTSLPTLGTLAVAVADLNNDGRPEIIFANYRNDSTWDVNSYIYWGQPGGIYGTQYGTSWRTELPTSGATGVAIADLNSDGRPEIIFPNYRSGPFHEINSYIYWGQSGGTYGTQYGTSWRTDLPTRGAQAVTVADLDVDGRPEVIFANYHTNADSNGNVNYNIDSFVYWGQAGGTFGTQYGPSWRTGLPGTGPTSISVADSNSDGNRDIVMQNFETPSTRIFWGPIPTSGTATNYLTLSGSGPKYRHISISLLNFDAWPDKVIAETGKWTGGNAARIYMNTGSSQFYEAPAFTLVGVGSVMMPYVSFGIGRGSSSGSFGQPRAFYGTGIPGRGVLESMLIDSGVNGTLWTSANGGAYVPANTNIELWVAASDNPAALSSPSWVYLGGLSNGSWTKAITSVSGRYARYRVQLTRNRWTDVSPALFDITLNYVTQAGAFNKTSPANGALFNSANVTVQWSASSNAANYQVCLDTSINGACNATWQTVGNVTSFTFFGLSNTTHEWQVRACWDSGCALHTYADGSVSNFRTFTVDTLAPNAPSVTLGGFTGVPPWNPTTVSYAHNGDNGPSGVNRIECSINGGAFSSPNCVTSAPPNHGTTISARVVDNAGNVGPVTTVTVQRDTQAPNAPSVTLGGFTGVPPWNPTTVSYAHNGDNGPSGVNRIECSINGGAFSSPNCVTSAPPNHGTTISARVVDNAGNVGPVTTVTVQRDTQAPNAPSVILGGFSGGTWNPTTISYAHNGDNGPSGVNWPASLQCSVDGGAWSSTCPDNTTLPTLPHGTTIAARVRDNAGNQGPAGTATVQRDTTAPATAISAIAPEYRNTPLQLFYAPTSDGGSPFATVRLLRRQSGADPWTDSGALTNGMGWTPPAQGRWYVASKVTDEAGNVEPDPTGATDDATFFYDTVAPSAPTVLSVGPSSSRTPNVAWSAGSDPGAPTTGSGVWTYRVLILRPDNSVVTQFDVAAPATNANVNVSLDDGDYIARVAAIDRAGNLGAYSAGFPFSVDSITTFGGVVYSDTAPLGQYNSESGVAGVPVTLTQPTSAVSTTTSSALGEYSFSGFTTLGYYTVSIGTPAGYVRTTPDEVRRLVVVGSDFLNVHFGLRYIGNLDTQYLWVNAQCTDGSPFPNAPFSVAGPALNTTAETGAEGNWAAEVSQPGVYTVTLIDTGISLVAPGNVNPVAVSVPAGGSAGAVFVLDCSDINEGTGAIVVRLFNADNPAATPALYAGRPVTASDGVSVLVQTTNAAGYVAFTGLVSGTWTVTAPVIGGQWLVQPGFEAYAQTVNVVAPLAGQVRYGYRAQNAAAAAEKDAEDLTDNGALHVGDVIRYTVSVTNNTGITLTTVRITDTLPVGLSFNGIESVTPAGCNAGPSGGQVLGLCAELGPGEMMRVVFTATVTETGRLVNSFVWSADQVGERPGDECANAPCDGEDPRPRARLHKRGEDVTDNGGFFAGDTVRYTLRLTNTMAVTQTNLRITDTLPVQLTLAGVGVPAGCVDTSVGNVASVLCAEVAPEQVVQVLITATVNLNAGGQTITNTFSWSSDQGDGELERPCVNVPCDNDDLNPPHDPPIGPLTAVKAAEDLTDNGGLYVGDTIRYTLTVTNVNAVTMTNVRITDVLPVELSLAGVDSVSAGCNDESSGNTVRASCAELAPGASATVVFRAVVQPAAAGRAIENRFVWSADQWPGTDNRSNTCVNAPCGGENPSAVAEKDAEDLTPNGGLHVGDVIRYTVSVTNNTGITLTTVRLTDTLPAGLRFNGIESVTPAGCNAGPSGGQVLGLCAELGPGEMMRVVFTATVTETGRLVNSFVWSADQVGERPGDECANAPCDGEDPRPRARLHKRGEDMTDNGGFFAGDTVRYTLRLTNTMAVTQTNLRITDTLPVQLTLAGVGVPAGCVDTSVGNVASVLCAQVAPGQVVQMVVTATVNLNAGGQTITNTFSWSSDQGDGELERPCVNVPCDPDDPNPPEEPPIGPLAAVKAAEDATDNGGLYVGDTIRYTLTVTNANVVTMTTVRITDALPAVLSLVGVDSVSAGCTDESSGNTVRVTCGELAPGASATVVFRAVVQPAAAGRAVENRFVWTADQWPQANNPSNTCINAPCGGENPTRGSRGHKVGVGELEVGAAVTYTLVVTNETGVTLVNLVITDALPAQLALSGVSVPAGCTDESSGNTAVVRCATLPVSQAVSVEVYATVVTTTGEIVNTFAWTADNLGPDEPPECWGLPCDSEDRPNLDNAETRKQAHASAVRVGELVTYTITLSNSGTMTATVAVTDVLDARLSYVDASIAPDSTAGGVLAWHGVVVPAGEARHITVTVRAGANTPLWASYAVTNSVQISYRSRTMARDAVTVEVKPWRVFLPMVMRPPELVPRLFIPMVMRP